MLAAVTLVNAVTFCHVPNLFVNAPPVFISTHMQCFYGDCAVSWLFGAII